jgi:hypothetical protein
MVIGTFGANFEYLRARHHAVVVSLFYHKTNWTEGGIDMNGAGIEAGYRYYTGSKGANGLFVGPSLVVVKRLDLIEQGRPDDPIGTLSYGVALDVGGANRL